MVLNTRWPAPNKAEKKIDKVNKIPDSIVEKASDIVVTPKVEEEVSIQEFITTLPKKPRESKRNYKIIEK